MFSLDLLRAGLRTYQLGREITYHPVTGSTNADLWELAAENKIVPGHVAITDEQRSGRGRLGRAWHNAPQLGLPFSVLLYPDQAFERYGLLPLGMGLAIVDALAFEGVKVQLKWPNDILWEERKLGGILTESRIIHGKPAVVIGVGLNVNEQIVDFPEELHAVAVSVCMILGRPIQRELLLARILNRFEELLESGLDKAASLWLKVCCHIDRTVRFHGPHGWIEGRFIGVDAMGQGLIEIEDEVRAFTAGELDLMPDKTHPA